MNHSLNYPVFPINKFLVFENKSILQKVFYNLMLIIKRLSWISNIFRMMYNSKPVLKERNQIQISNSKVIQFL